MKKLVSGRKFLSYLDKIEDKDLAAQFFRAVQENMSENKKVEMSADGVAGKIYELNAIACAEALSKSEVSSKIPDAIQLIFTDHFTPDNMVEPG